MARIYKYFLIGFASLVLLLGLGVTIVISKAPEWIKSKAVDYIEGTGYHLSLGEIELHPLSLRAQLNNVTLDDSQTNHLINFDQLNIQLSLNGILQKHIDIKEIELIKATIFATKDRESWNWQRFFKAVKEAKKKKSDHSPFDIVIHSINVSKSELHIHDQVADYQIELSPLDFNIHEFGTIKPGGKIALNSEENPISLGEFNFDIAGYNLHTGDVELNPDILKFMLKDFQISKLGGKSPLFFSEHAELQLTPDGLLKKHFHINYLTITRPQLLLQKEDKKWNFQVFIESLKDRFKHPKSQTKSTEILIDKVKVDELRLKMIDNRPAHGYTASIDHLNLEMHDVTNLEQAHLFSTYQLSSSPLHWESHTSKKSINLGTIKASGQWSRRPNKDVEFAFNGQLDHGQASIKGLWSKVTKESSLKLKLKDLSLLPVIELLPAYFPLVAKNGSISTDLSIQTKPTGFSANGNLQFGPSIIFEPNHDSELIGWKSADFNRLQLETTPDKSTVAINEIHLNTPTGRMIFFEDRSSNFKRIFSKPKTDPNKPKRSLDLDIRNITLSDGEVDFTDYSIKPFFQTKISNLHGSLSGFSNRPGQFAGLALNGTIDRTGEMIANGHVAFEDPRRNNDLSVQFIRIPLKAVNPYAKSFAGYEILDGALSLSLNYKVTDANLEGANQITINQIKLGEPIPGYNGKLKNIPVKRALAFLEDDNGVINLDIPITGNIDHPHFDAHALVWEAISSAIHNAWNTPSRVSQRVLGLDDFEGLLFEPGQSFLRNREKEKISLLIKALQAKPGTILNLHGSYDPTIDRQQLMTLQLNRQIFELAGFKITANDALPTLTLSDSRIRSIVQSLYIKTFGTKQWVDKAIAIKDNPSAWDMLYKELLETITIDDQSLFALAISRGIQLRKAFLEINSAIAPQIQIGTNKVTQSSKSGILQEISLSNE